MTELKRPQVTRTPLQPQAGNAAAAAAIGEGILDIGSMLLNKHIDGEVQDFRVEAEALIDQDLAAQEAQMAQGSDQDRRLAEAGSDIDRQLAVMSEAVQTAPNQAQRIRAVQGMQQLIEDNYSNPVIRARVMQEYSVLTRTDPQLTQIGINDATIQARQQAGTATQARKEALIKEALDLGVPGYYAFGSPEWKGEYKYLSDAKRDQAMLAAMDVNTSKGLVGYIETQTTAPTGAYQVATRQISTLGDEYIRISRQVGAGTKTEAEFIPFQEKFYGPGGGYQQMQTAARGAIAAIEKPFAEISSGMHPDSEPYKRARNAADLKIAQIEQQVAVFASGNLADIVTYADLMAERQAMVRLDLADRLPADFERSVYLDMNASTIQIMDKLDTQFQNTEASQTLAEFMGKGMVSSLSTLAVARQVIGGDIEDPEEVRNELAARARAAIEKDVLERVGPGPGNSTTAHPTVSDHAYVQTQGITTELSSVRLQADPKMVGQLYGAMDVNLHVLKGTWASVSPTMATNYEDAFITDTAIENQLAATAAKVTLPELQLAAKSMFNGWFRNQRSPVYVPARYETLVTEFKQGRIGTLSYDQVLDVTVDNAGTFRVIPNPAKVKEAAATPYPTTQASLTSFGTDFSARQLLDPRGVEQNAAETAIRIQEEMNRIVRADAVGSTYNNETMLTSKPNWARSAKQFQQTGMAEKRSFVEVFGAEESASRQERGEGTPTTTIDLNPR